MESRQTPYERDLLAEGNRLEELRLKTEEREERWRAVLDMRDAGAYAYEGRDIHEAVAFYHAAYIGARDDWRAAQKKFKQKHYGRWPLK
jgi:hypothetical protein